MRLTQFRDFPSSPQVATFPDASFARFSVGIVGGGTYVIQHGIDIFPATIPISELWLTGSKPIFSWSIHCPNLAPHPGLSLSVEISYDGAAVAHFNGYFIPAGAVPSVMEGLFIPGYSVRFTLINASPTVLAQVHGMIKQQGCE